MSQLQSKEFREILLLKIPAIYFGKGTVSSLDVFWFILESSCTRRYGFQMILKVLGY